MHNVLFLSFFFCSNPELEQGSGGFRGGIGSGVRTNGA